MKSLITTISAAILITGCASISPVSISGPSGGQAYTMKCSGLGRTIEQCYAKAGELCPSGYSVVSQSSTSRIVPGNGDAGPFSVTKENLTIECD